MFFIQGCQMMPRPTDGPMPDDSDDEDLAALCRSFQAGFKERGASQSPSKRSEEEDNSSN